jgi:hypothetical protein
MGNIMMKARLLVAAAILALLCACQNSFNRPENVYLPSNAEKGAISISLDLPSEALGPEASNARTALPNTDFDSYALSFVSAQGFSHAPLSPFASGQTVELEPGEWTLRVDGFKSGDANPIGTGTKTVAISAGTNTSATITIGPNTEYGGEGTFSYTVRYPEGAYRERKLTVFDMAGRTVETRSLAQTGAGSGNIICSDSVDLSPGLYSIQLYIFNIESGLAAVKIDYAHIYRGFTSSGDYGFTQANFAGFVPVEGTASSTHNGAEWNSGDLTSQKIAAYRDAACLVPLVEEDVDIEAGNVAPFALMIPAGFGTIYLRLELEVTGFGWLYGAVRAVNIGLNPETGIHISGISFNVPSGTAKVIYAWVNENDQIVTSDGALTLSRSANESLAISVTGSGYSDCQWSCNGSVVAEETTNSYTFNSAEKNNGNYNIGLLVKKGVGANAPWYSTLITIAVTN